MRTGEHGAVQGPQQVASKVGLVTRLAHRMMFSGAAWLATGLACAAPPQTVYRCGPDGRIYSQTPCSEGREGTVDDARSPAQQRAARGVAAQEAKTAQQLADERRQREAAANKSSVAIGIKPAPPAEPASSARPPKAKPAAEPVYVAPRASQAQGKTAASK